MLSMANGCDKTNKCVRWSDLPNTGEFHTNTGEASPFAHYHTDININTERFRRGHCAPNKKCVAPSLLCDVVL